MLLKRVRKRQRDIERFVLTKLLPKVWMRSIRKAQHFREWFRVPMNYVRIIELPLTYELLELNRGQSVLDISSPKLLSLYMGMIGIHNLIVTDVEDYFIRDFETFSEIFGINYNIEVFDATRIPFKNQTFDRVFSISVLEHIPRLGDIEVVKEVSRILKPNGIFLITLPAFSHYLEEWLKDAKLYWKSERREDGSIFYQRRYDICSIKERFGNSGLAIEEVIFIAEKPIKKPKLNQNGMLLHNCYYYKGIPFVKFLSKLSRLKLIPLIPYIGHRYASMRYHYLTRDKTDKNIRQVAVKLLKI